MSDKQREQIYNQLISKKTEDLLEIWQNGDTADWEKGTFDVIKEILLERIASLPPQSIKTQVSQIMDKVEEHLENQAFDKALEECEIAIRMDPGYAIAYDYCGDIYAELGQRGNALTSYQKAVQLDPELSDAREKMLSIEAMIKEEVETKVSQILDKAEEHLENNALDKALIECEHAIQVDPGCALAYDYRGDIYAELGERESALASYQKAVQFDPNLSGAWKNLLSIEAEIGSEFEGSRTRQILDQALEYANNDEPELAMAECEKAKLSIPAIAIAYNYLGLVLQTANQPEPAIEAYLKAIQFNPRFYPARENLASARLSWEAEQYRSFENLDALEAQETTIEFDESRIPENDEPMPQWLYMDEKAFHLVGWAGHRTRQGRSGYDPLELDFELAHIQGVVIRRLLTCKFRTRYPIYLIFMAWAGCLFSLYGILPFTLGNWGGIVAGVISSPYSVVGITLLINVVLSLRLKKPDEDEDDGNAFW